MLSASSQKKDGQRWYTQIQQRERSWEAHRGADRKKKYLEGRQRIPKTVVVVVNPTCNDNGRMSKLAVNFEGLSLGKKSIHDDDDDDAEEKLLRSHPELDGTDLRRRMAIYDYVFAGFPPYHGKQISRKARDEKKFRVSSLVYGEITYGPFYATLKKIDAKGTFVDLGSGAGKPVIAAATLGSFDKCIGVEYLQALVDASLDAKRRFDGHRVSKIPFSSSAVDFVQADVTDLTAYDWSDADVLYANSTCFDDTLMAAIAHASARLKKGTTFITFTKRLPSPDFVVTDSQLYQMSWGGATVFIQSKITDPISPDDLLMNGDHPPVSTTWTTASNDDDFISSTGDSLGSGSGGGVVVPPILAPSLDTTDSSPSISPDRPETSP